jgi:outer membrane protein assembly factor BamB
VALLLDGDRLIVSVQGYTYCHDALTGQQLWYNPLKGYGLGVSPKSAMFQHSSLHDLTSMDFPCAYEFQR